MKSPRTEEFKTTTGTVADKHFVQSGEEHKKSSKERKKGKSYSAHRRHKSDELNSIVELTETEAPNFLSQSEEVVDYQLSDPGPFNPPPQLPPRHRGGSGSTFNITRPNLHNRPIQQDRPSWRRVHSSGTMSSPGKGIPPTQEYFVPADTLRNVQRTSFVPHNGAIGGPVHHHGGHSTKDKKNMDMHFKIVAQNDPTMMSKRKSRSLEHLIDNSDYSLPFDIVTDKSGVDPRVKNRSPESLLSAHSNHTHQSSRSDTNLTTRNSQTPPVKPARHTRDFNKPPTFAPPPPPQNEEINFPPSPTVVRRGDDYEEPWDSSRFHLPRPNRRQTESSKSDIQKSPRPTRSHTIHHETSPEPDLVIPGVPPRSSSRNRTETADSTIGHSPSSPLLDTNRPRAITGEQTAGDYCIPPDAILHDIKEVGAVVKGRQGGQLLHGGYINQPPIPPHMPPIRAVERHRYPPLVPSDYYISDIQNLPPPAHPIDLSVPLDDQP